MTAEQARNARWSKYALEKRHKKAWYLTAVTDSTSKVEALKFFAKDAPFAFRGNRLRDGFRVSKGGK